MQRGGENPTLGRNTRMVKRGHVLYVAFGRFKCSIRMKQNQGLKHGSLSSM